MKKLLSIILVAVLLVTAMPIDTFELKASAATRSYYTCTVSNGKATITKGTICVWRRCCRLGRLCALLD